MLFRRHRGPSVCLSVCISVTLVHPAKAVGQHEMTFGRDTRVAPSNTLPQILDGGPEPHEKGKFGDRRDQSSLLVFARCQHLCRGDATLDLLWSLFKLIFILN